MKKTTEKRKWNRMIRKVQGGNAFTTSSIAKRLFTLVSFATYFALIVFILFQIKGLPSNGDEARNIAWLALMVVFVWQAARFSNTNLHVSFSTINISFVMALVMNGYAITFVFMKFNYEPSSWSSLIDQYYWWLPLLVWNALWKLMFAVFEYKARPFFGIQKLLSFITNSFIIAIIAYGVHFAERFVIKKEHFDYLEPSTFLGLALMLIGGLIAGFFMFIDVVYFTRFAKTETKSKKAIRIWTALLQVGPVSIWLIYSAIAGQLANFHLDFGMKEWIFLAVAVIGIILVITTVLTRKEAGGASRVFVVISSTAIALIVITGYLFQVWWKEGVYENVIILMPALTVLLIIYIIVEPETPKFFSISFQSLFTTISSYGILIWILSSAVTKNMNLPFHIDDILLLPAVVSATAIEIVSLSSYWWIVTRISKYSSKAYKQHIKIQGVKHE